MPDASSVGLSLDGERRGLGGDSLYAANGVSP